MTTKSDNQSPSLLKATYGVIKAVFMPSIDPDYEFKFPQRKILHEKAPPVVQAVNQYLDEKGVDLHQDHVEHFERGFEIDDHPVEGYQQKLSKWGKTIKNEKKIINSFVKEVEEETQKGIEADPTKVIYGQAGVIAHTLFGTVKAATNPYVAHENDLSIGTLHDYLDYRQDIKSSMK